MQFVEFIQLDTRCLPLTSCGDGDGVPLNLSNSTKSQTVGICEHGRWALVGERGVTPAVERLCAVLNFEYTGVELQDRPCAAGVKRQGLAL